MKPKVKKIYTNEWSNDGDIERFLCYADDYIDIYDFPNAERREVIGRNYYFNGKFIAGEIFHENGYSTQSSGKVKPINN